MELISIPGNPAPSGANVFPVAARGRAVFRAAYWKATGDACAGTVAILPGRAEFIEKYFEVIGELLVRNFDVAILDWRGQGGSRRLVKNPRKGHIGNFRFYEHDLEAFAEHVLAPYCRRPWFALAHSMGAAIALAQARAGRSPFARLVLTAPMIDVYGLRKRRAPRMLARALVWLGAGRLSVWRTKPDPHIATQFEGNILTSDERRHARMISIIQAAPSLAIEEPTIGWANAAFRLMRRFEEYDYASQIFTPALVVAAGRDRLVDTAAAEEFARRLKTGTCITLEQARHEILMERDAVRAQFWAAFDAFIPGEGAASSASEAKGEQAMARLLEASALATAESGKPSS
ncbi:MAG TPA: alpha/beta hydrolase [Methylocella sp.]|nr:alpha/beta hydrolase [Methylocella sp.]